MSKTGSIHNETLVELYKLCVEMADRISQRRQLANSYFLSINTAIISLLMITFVIYYRLTGNMPPTHLLVIVIGAVSLVGIANCWVWCSLIRSYHAMNDAKFKVIHEMEKIIGYRPYFDEWQHLIHGENKETYHKFTIVESRVPKIFLIGYVAAIVMLLLILVI